MQWHFKVFSFYGKVFIGGKIIAHKLIDSLVGEIKLYETNNDKSVNGSLNYSLLYIDDWKYEYGSFENMPFKELRADLTAYPTQC